LVLLSGLVSWVRCSVVIAENGGSGRVSPTAIAWKTAAQVSGATPVRPGLAAYGLAPGGGWRRGIPHEKRDYLPLTADVLAGHLKIDAHVSVSRRSTATGAGGTTT